MNNDYIKENLRYSISLRTSLWATLIVLMGGILNLFLNLDNILKLILIIIGFLIVFIIVKSIMSQDIKIEKLLDKLEKE